MAASTAISNSKDELACEASKALVARSQERWQEVVEGAPEAPRDALLAHYLSHRNVVEHGTGCVLRGADAGGQPLWS